MSTMSVKEALAAVLKDMRAMSADQLRDELLAHKDGEIATALREAEQFLALSASFYTYPITHIRELLQGDTTEYAMRCSLEGLEIFLAANDSCFALAA